MPYSTNYFKTETIKYITDKYDFNSRILDIGVGQGTYSKLLRPLGYNNIDGVEVFDKYVDLFDLKSKYNNLYIGDITKLDIDFSLYDLIIVGDVLEHIDYYDSKILLNKFNGVNSIVAIPFNSEQGVHFDNLHEIHLQPDLTFINFFKKFNGYHPLCLRFDYGVFVNEPIDTLYLEKNEYDLPIEYSDYIDNNFNTLKINYI